MSGIGLARDLALLGAETLVATPRDRLAFEEGRAPSAHAERWRHLGQQMLAHERSPDRLRDRLVTDCGLGRLDYWLVVLATAAERYPDAAAALSILSEDARLQLPTPISFAQLMHGALEVTFVEAFQASLNGGAAASLGLVQAVETAPGRPSTQQALRVEPSELPALLASGASDVGACGVARAAVGEMQPPMSEPAFPDALVSLGRGLLNDSRLLCLRCVSPRAGLQLALDVASRLRLPIQILRVTSAHPSLALVRRVRDALPVLDLTGLDKLSQESRSLLAEARASLPRTIALVADEAEIPEFVTLSVPRLGAEQARVIWTAATADREMAENLARRFIVSLPEARTAVARADQTASANPLASRTERIACEVLDEGARRIGKFVTRVRSNARLSDLVASPSLTEQLHEIVQWRRVTQRVFGEMAFGRQSPLGRGLTVLFSGPPGTGKTFAALCLANELGLNLYRIDLSQIVSKYIGETEKSLAKIFDEAEAGHGVLLFDEADALFGKRSEVKDAHDRYANIEVGYLLQRIEAFEGVAILATNLRSNIDAAFTRRLRFLLDFPMPDETMRHRLWEQALPHARYRSDDLDIRPFVGRFRLSGGSIQNIGLAGAHLAAATPEGRITPALLVRAAYRELEKSGQSRSRASFGPLACYLPEDAE